MNARWQPSLPAPAGTPLPMVEAAWVRESRFQEYLDILIDSRWLIAGLTALALVAGAGYALFGPRVYEANILIQVEDSDRSGGNFPGDATGGAGISVKTPVAGETEILRSRMVLGQAMENTRLYISAKPRYIPVVGEFLARHSNRLSTPGIFGMGDYVSGTERIAVAQMDVPQPLEGKKFLLTAEADGNYTLTNSGLEAPLQGKVGVPLDAAVPGGTLHLLVGSFEAEPGAGFELVRYSKQLTLLGLQKDLRVVEKGKQSGVMDVSLQAENRGQLADVLNEISRLYVRQNIDQKTVQAERALAFLGTELPKFKAQLEQSEDSYNQYRNQNGTISLDDEARNALSQNVDLQAKLLDAKQKRLDLVGRFTAAHPAVQTLDSQIASLKKELGAVDGRIRRMPMLQQNSLRMQRDIKVNTDLYATLLNSSLQMRLAKEGKVANVRVLDQALLPEKPVRPKALIVMALSLAGGLFLGGATALLRKTLKKSIGSPDEIEAVTGLNVYSTIALSTQQRVLDRAIRGGKPGVKVLAALHVEDPALEGLRRLRTALKFVMLGAPNNRVLISSATPGAGKTFVSSNFATLVASSGKRVLLIDADLRRGTLSEEFGLQRKDGLSDVITGGVPLDRAIHYHVLPRLDVMTSGTLHPDPAGMMTSDVFAQTLATLSSRYDVVIVDAPPTLLASETAAMAPSMGTLLLVARADHSESGELLESVKRLGHVGAEFHGVVFNAVDTTQRHYRGYSYGYYDAYRREPAGSLGVNDADTVMPKRLEPEHAA
ncbi:MULTISPECIES: polysaccharide biosynthesis tyrosine autokinase [Variovorax]|jgi:tyrosine-protein kinase Etk/Wzc|uniref:polysaccharide biosynthesis tyrosine autokinase n=1 Tax=Variovorax TaxID=34072 RepID=UPI00086A9F0C|nr:MULTISPECIES: polysaccharide biosynthesis tyrosine autokinase [Variovorax]MBN8751865.1 polysaccharide biosynthesis tyrosine autokinase [Variovorax sp.]ODU17686.1 MAG: tyrosine protein kinase [Variovorax sp. SCN 67-85]ODV27043.1 MAG: tyrosine protein kinase [Variovorax sp. SCN 67-20]OJZ09302.1 MAG: tyrosine protein kinase [Variovorax sp. 67-131]UKI04878.1 polysaccharide biosynthesis tyrosine autokinase [Variovorax paradoxus]